MIINIDARSPKSSLPTTSRRIPDFISATGHEARLPQEKPNITYPGGLVGTLTDRQVFARGKAETGFTVWSGGPVTLAGRGIDGMKIITVYDLSGRLLRKLTTAASEIDIGKDGRLLEGIYLVRIAGAAAADFSLSPGK